MRPLLLVLLFILTGGPALAQVPGDELATRAMCVEYRKNLTVMDIVRARLDTTSRDPKKIAGLQSTLDGLKVFEDLYLRPYMDKETQRALFDTRFPTTPLPLLDRTRLNVACRRYARTLLSILFATGTLDIDSSVSIQMLRDAQ